MTVLPGITIYAEINSVPLDTYGWRVMDAGYDEFLSSAPVRGENLVMPGARGRRPYDPIEDQKVVPVPLLISGAFDEDGAPIATPSTGMLQHRDYLAENLGLRTLVPCRLHRGPDLPDWIGDVQPLGLYGWTTLSTATGDAMVRLDLIIPDAELEPEGS